MLLNLGSFMFLVEKRNRSASFSVERTDIRMDINNII
jgi:hypothetical protein